MILPIFLPSAAPMRAAQFPQNGFCQKILHPPGPRNTLRAAPNLRKPCLPQSFFSDLLPQLVSCLTELIKHHFNLRAASGSLSPFRW